MQSSVQIRVPASLTDRLLGEIVHHKGREGLAFALASHTHIGDSTVILVRNVIVPPDSVFLSSAGHGARWTGAYSIELLNRCLKTSTGLFIVHYHSSYGQISLSGDDLASASELLPKFQLIQPGRPHGSIVLGPDSAAAAVLLPGEDHILCTDSARLYTNRVITYPLPPADRDRLERQALVVSEGTQHVLWNATVAVVGLSGGGSQVVPHLSRAGIGTIIGIDPQRVCHDNLGASPSFSWLDAILKPRKTSAARRKAWWANPAIRFVSVPNKAAEPEAVKALKTADVIVGCVNNLNARADILEVAWRFCIPYVDIGMRITTSDESKKNLPEISGVSGNIFTAIPGGACLWCIEFLTKEKLDSETDGRGRCYVLGDEDADALVSCFNGILAAQAVAEVLQLLLGYSPPSIRVPYKRYDGFEGTLTPCRVVRKPSCAFCGSMLAAGDPIWN